MAEVRSKMSDVKSQVLEARGPAEPRPGPSGAFSVEEMPSHHADSDSCRKPSELDLLGRAAAARSRSCRPGENCYSFLKKGMNEYLYWIVDNAETIQSLAMCVDKRRLSAKAAEPKQ